MGGQACVTLFAVSVAKGSIRGGMTGSDVTWQRIRAGMLTPPISKSQVVAIVSHLAFHTSSLRGLLDILEEMPDFKV